MGTMRRSLALSDTEIPEGQKVKVRKVIAANALNMADAADLLAMLGLIDVPPRPPKGMRYRHFGVEECRVCGRRMAHSRAERTNPERTLPRYGGDSMCETHYRAARRRKLKQHKPHVVHTHCIRCGVELVPAKHKPLEGQARHRGHGLCDFCYRHTPREGTQCPTTK